MKTRVSPFRNEKGGTRVPPWPPPHLDTSSPPGVPPFPIPRPLPPLEILSFIFGSIYCELPPEPDFGLPLQRSLCSSAKGAIFLAFFSRRLLALPI
ncbi:hypothetical protein GW17_00031150 [Ensete ventricosum]|nr:hypothetical protein GW17_00031150 [Ensete ventricosum]